MLYTCFKDFDFRVTDFIFSVNSVASFIVCFIVTAVSAIIVANDEQHVVSLA